MTVSTFVHRSDRYLLAFVQLCSFCGHVWSQQVSMELKPSIDQKLQALKAAEHDHDSAVRIGRLWGGLASDYETQADFQRAEDAYLHSIRLLRSQPSAEAEYATVLDRLGDLYLAYGRIDEAEEYMGMGLEVRRKGNSLVAFGTSQMHLAEIAAVRHRFKDAEKGAVEAVTTLTSAGEQGRGGLIAALLVLSCARCSMKSCTEGIRDAEHAGELARTLHSRDLPPLGLVQMALGYAKWKSGDAQEAEKLMLEGIRLIATQDAPNSPNVRNALLEYRSFLQAMHRKGDVKRVDDQLAQALPQTCVNCTVNINSLSNAMR